ncbi:MAG: CHC2 zinc finger domain-containing protein [Roseburia sp.]
MNVDEIKQRYSMIDIVEQYGFHPNRTGFISCPFHTGDNSPSMKIYPKDFHCHACGANGDIFTFIQRMDNCDFKTAFYSLGGTYQKPTDSSKLAKYRLEKAKENRHKMEERIKSKIRLNNSLIGIYVTWIKKLEPFSDAWCDCMNEYTKCLGIDEELQKEMEGCAGKL